MRETTGESDARRVTLLAAGDVGLQGDGSANPLSVLSSLRPPSAVTVVNLEVALSLRTGHEAEKAVRLAAPPARAAWLAEAGVDVVNVANNHVLDLGPAGFDDTLEALHASGVAFCGGGNPRYPQGQAVVEREGLRLGFLGYCLTPFAEQGRFVRCLDAAAACADVRALAEACDAVIVSLHAGVEDSHYPSPLQIRQARQLVEAGATVVLGHHPHVVQGVERWGRGLIAYSLGNFQFPPLLPAHREAFALSVELTRRAVAAYRILPLRLDSGGAPAALDAGEAARLRERVEALSAPIVANRVDDRRWFAHIARPYLQGNLRSWKLRVRRYGLRHALQFARWAVSPFVLRCYRGLLRRALQRHDPEIL